MSRGAQFDVVVGVDYSELSEAALLSALDLARRRGGRVHAISVADGYGPPRLPDDLAAEAKDQYRAQAMNTLESYVEERCARLDREGQGIERPRVLLAVDFGRPEERILALADNLRADLIALGTHGRRGIDHLLLGSVAEHVLRSAHCPVLVVRA
jgi:nucleotide-binding universal stress UspA family protein